MCATRSKFKINRRIYFENKAAAIKHPVIKLLLLTCVVQTLQKRSCDVTLGWSFLFFEIVQKIAFTVKRLKIHLFELKENHLSRFFIAFNCVVIIRVTNFTSVPRQLSEKNFTVFSDMKNENNNYRCSAKLTKKKSFSANRIKINLPFPASHACQRYFILIDGDMFQSNN